MKCFFAKHEVQLSGISSALKSGSVQRGNMAMALKPQQISGEINNPYANHGAGI